MLKKVIRGWLTCCLAVPGLAIAADLGLDDAIGLARANSPGLRVAELRILTYEAQRDQANVFPNPDLELQVENVAGDGEFSGTDAAEYTVFISQSIRMGSKRTRQVRVVDAARSLAEWDRESEEHELVRSVTALFVQVLEDRERVALSKEFVKLSGQLVQSAERRVKAGGASVLEQTKAEIEHASTMARQQRMKQRLQSSSRQLASLVGVPASQLPPLKGDLYEMEELPVFEVLKSRLSQSPAWARWSDEIEQRAAVSALARTLRVPDLDLGVGWRRDEAAGSDAFLFSAGFPLPLFDRGGGSRRAAQFQLTAAEAERRAAELALERQVAALYGELVEFHAAARAIEETILPMVNKAFDVSREGYLQGRFGYIDLLDAQRTLFNVRSEYIDVLGSHHQTRAKLDRLTSGTSRLKPQDAKDQEP